MTDLLEKFNARIAKQEAPPPPKTYADGTPVFSELNPFRLADGWEERAKTDPPYLQANLDAIKRTRQIQAEARARDHAAEELEKANARARARTKKTRDEAAARETERREAEDRELARLAAR